MDLKSPKQKKPPLATQLKGLELHLFERHPNEHLELLEANPGLSSLSLCMDSDRLSVPMDDFITLLKPLTALQSLALGGDLPLQPATLKKVLDRNQRLESLYLIGFTGTGPDFDDWSIYSSIRKVHFHCHLTTSTCIFRLLQHCPKVEALTVYIACTFSMRDGEVQIAFLVKVLQEHCRKVKVLTLGETFHGNAVAIATMDCFKVIQSTHNLVKLRILTDDFSLTLCDALLHGSSHSLEVLFLDVRGNLAKKDSIVSVGKVLSSCPNLRHFHVVFQRYPGYSGKTDKALANRPWVCKRLETITLKSRRSDVLMECPSICKGKVSEFNCSIEAACAVDIRSQGWRRRDPYEGHHVPMTRQKHRAALLTAASALQHVHTIDLGFCVYEHDDRPAKPFEF
ncbi:hypothetical protein BGZ94_003561 [Podila epigama]|nr:hypothetical protein BGZ94_003561 [Podila epigama]